MKKFFLIWFLFAVMAITVVSCTEKEDVRPTYNGGGGASEPIHP